MRSRICSDLALGHEAAAVHEDDVRRERLDFVQHVAGNDHAVAAFAQAADHGNQVAAGDGVRAAERFVQKQHAGFVDQGLGQLDPLPHALRIAANRAAHVLRHADPGDGLFGGRGRRAAAHARQPAQVRTKSSPDIHS